MRASLIAAIFALTVQAAPQTFRPDAEGFIRNWLVLAPLPLEGESGAAEIDREFVKDEATMTPKAGEKLAIGSNVRSWTAHQTNDYFIDFLKSFGTERGEYVAGYAVAYVVSGAEMNVTLALSTNDQGKAWLNGKQVLKFPDTRTLEKDTERVPVTLVKGQNVLVLKVINEVNNWQGCARFLKDGAPVKDIEIRISPQ